MRSMMSSTLSVTLIVLVFLAASTGSAHAYIDAGSGAFIFQVLAASLFASLFTIKLFWGKVIRTVATLFTRLRNVTKTHG